mmetsp:Transcript_25072/g.57937  ORF Transcript_25072/g.57937 Transcript_25072/m.57937 type:complete len:232 (+) Transcript_25072:847-1542(+)
MPDRNRPPVRRRRPSLGRGHVLLPLPFRRDGGGRRRRHGLSGARPPRGAGKVLQPRAEPERAPAAPRHRPKGCPALSRPDLPPQRRRRRAGPGRGGPGGGRPARRHGGQVPGGGSVGVGGRRPRALRGGRGARCLPQASSGALRETRGSRGGAVGSSEDPTKDPSARAGAFRRRTAREALSYRAGRDRRPAQAGTGGETAGRRDAPVRASSARGRFDDGRGGAEHVPGRKL